MQILSHNIKQEVNSFYAYDGKYAIHIVSTNCQQLFLVMQVNCLKSKLIGRIIVTKFVLLILTLNFVVNQLNNLKTQICINSQFSSNKQMKRGQEQGDFDGNVQKTVKQIFQIFASDKRIIDLGQVQNLLQKNKAQIGQSQLFLKKIRNAQQRTMTYDQFMNYFSRCNDKKHFQAVFQAIDTDGSKYINIKQIRNINKTYQIGLSQDDIHMMIRQVSKDGQKVGMNQLINFLSGKSA